MAARSLLFQLPRLVSSSLGALYHRASSSAGPGLQRILAADTSLREVAAHSEGDAIVASSLHREADVAAELLGVKRRAPSPKAGRPGKPKENPGRDKHNGVPDKKAKGGEQGTRNNYAASTSS